ncbi:GreA/GreB family elongation factor [Rhodococcus fascians]|nr:GreA/GreB family elongation factor [Rhodococcus fascians]MBY4239987.1 GreA/GreB family elongation factor [Rhodococcus fascians]MBY4255591.1 GreA/GreB family elongation factor [Rhodococcus fascians]MBY4271452.1 GreA/GreB family elongation factor [Rhodococcus fascians]
MTTIDHLPFDTPTSAPREQLSELLESRVTAFNNVLVQRSSGDLENNDAYHRARAELQRIDRMIADVKSRIAESDASKAVDRDIAGPGSAVTVMFGGDEKDVETFVLVEHATESSDRTCSTASPLGAALDGSRVRDVRTYPLPSGAESTVTVLGIAWP